MKLLRRWMTRCGLVAYIFKFAKSTVRVRVCRYFVQNDCLMNSYIEVSEHIYLLVDWLLFWIREYKKMYLVGAGLDLNPIHSHFC